MFSSIYNILSLYGQKNTIEVNGNQHYLLCSAEETNTPWGWVNDTIFIFWVDYTFFNCKTLIVISIFLMWNSFFLLTELNLYCTRPKSKFSKIRLNRKALLHLSKLRIETTVFSDLHKYVVIAQYMVLDTCHQT